MTFGDFPFGLCDLAELKGINSAVSPHALPNNNIVNDKNDVSNLNNNSYRFYNLCDKVIDENIVNLTNCKYYSISECYNSIESNNFNIFHNIVNGLEFKFENFHHFLTNAPIKFDTIAVTETTQRITNEFYTNIKLEGYTHFSTATNTNKGSTIIYTKTHLMLQKGLISIYVTICMNQTGLILKI